MRRAPIVLSATAVGLVGVLTFKPREPALPSLAAAAPTADPVVTATTPAPAPTGTTAATGATPATSGTTGAAKPTEQKAPATVTVDGDAIDTRYGATQVRVTLKDGTITNVEALALPSKERKSIDISYGAEPLLRQSALTKQTAAIDVVSGATITSAGYEASMQSALDKAGFKAADGSRGSSTIPDVEEHDGPSGGGGPPPGMFPG